MTTDDDPPEPAARDPLVEQADAAHEAAVRKLQGDVRLADRFEELDHGSRDVMFYRIHPRATGNGAQTTLPGLGGGAEPPAPKAPVDPTSAEASKTASEPSNSDAVTPRPVEVPGVGQTQRLVQDVAREKREGTASEERVVPREETGGTEATIAPPRKTTPLN